MKLECSARLTGGALLCAALVACTTAPPAEMPSTEHDDLPAAAALAQSTAPTFEQKQRERAQSLTRRGRLADAALAWEILTVFRPDAVEYRERLADTRRQIDAAVAERSQRGAQAFKRGELDNASAYYLAALALQPDQPQAADALRAIERERNKRSYLGKYSRVTLTHRATVQAEVVMPRKPVGATADRNELEHASMLATQGEFDDAIQLLERRLAGDRRDEAARLLLADVYYQKAEKLAVRDKAAAITALQKSVRLDATHTRAAARLQQLKSGAATGGTAAPAALAPRPAAKD